MAEVRKDTTTTSSLVHPPSEDAEHSTTDCQPPLFGNNLFSWIVLTVLRETMTEPNTPMLRMAVRLVHCLQRERGASCAFGGNPELFQKKLTYARQQTNLSLKLWQESADIQSVTHTMAKIRRQLDTESKQQKEEEERSMGHFHRILVLFNTLISSVVHACVLEHVNMSTGKYGRQRFTKPDKLKRSASDLSRVIQEIKPLKKGIPRNHSAEGILRRPGVPTANKAYPLLNKEKKTVEFTTVEGSKISSLLSLIEIFVRLKESTGFERALLMSMFSTRRVDRRLLNDLVLEVENQFKLIQDLHEIKDVESGILQLTREGVVLSKPMERLQNYILREFDLKGFHQELKTTDVWNLISVYMDRLHSLELLLIEELECCLMEEKDARGVAYLTKTQSGKSGQAPEDVDHALTEIFSSNGKLSTTALQDMSPEEMKKKVLSWVSSRPATPTKKSRTITRSSSMPVKAPFLGAPEDKPAPSEWDIDLYELQFQRRIGRGTAGTTYLAKWSGQQVAVKVAAITQMGLEGWKTEVESLRKLHHPNIIRLLGSVYNEAPLTYCLVLEYCNAGDLDAALKNPTPPSFFFTVGKDMAHGLAYLHSRQIIHRDIKPSNVLLHGSLSAGVFGAKVSDFGIAAVQHKKDMTCETGTYRWMSPEVIRHEPYSEKADVFSYTMVLWQLLTREDPFMEHSPLEAAGKVALEFSRPELPKGIPLPIKELLEIGWHENPQKRFDLTEATKLLEEHRESLPNNELKWLQSALGHPVYAAYEEEEEEESTSERQTGKKGKRKTLKNLFKKRNSS